MSKKRLSLQKALGFNGLRQHIIIGLFDRSLLHMSLIQVELALKKATSKSRTPVSIYQFDPI